MVAVRDEHADIGEALLKPAGQHRAHHIFSGIVSGVNQVEAQRLRLLELVVFDVRGDKGIASAGRCQGAHIPAGAAAHSHLADRASPVHKPDAVGAQQLLYLSGECLCAGRSGDNAGTADAILTEGPHLLQAQGPRQRVIDALRAEQV